MSTRSTERSVHGRISSRRMGFTLIEILVVVAIIALLVSILLPSLKNARESAVIVVCKMRMAQLFNGHNYYAHDNKVIPHWSWWLYDGVGHNEPKVSFNNPVAVYRPTGGVRAPDANSSRWVEYGDIYKYVKDKEAYFCPRDNKVRAGSSLGGGKSGQGMQPIHSFTRLCDVNNFYQEKISGVANDDCWDGQLGPGDFIRPDNLRPGCLKSAKWPRVNNFQTIPAKLVLLYEEYQGTGGDSQGFENVGLNDGHSTLTSDPDLMSMRHIQRGNVVFFDGHTETIDSKRWNRFPSDIYGLHKALGGGNPPRP